MNAGMRTLSGITFLTSEITRFDITNTNAVAAPIPKPFTADEVTPNVGQHPSNNTNTGFSRMTPFQKTSLLVIAAISL
jgi:hypothetical protein